MDFGIDKLIEMFEDRFGKAPATGLLFLVGLGAASLAIHAFAVYFVIPTGKLAVSLFNYFPGHKVSVLIPDYLVIACEIAWGCICAAIVWGFFRIFIYPKMHKITDRHIELGKYLDELQGDVNAGIAAIHESIEAAKAAGIDVSKIKLPAYRKPTGYLASHPLVQKHLEKLKK